MAENITLSSDDSETLSKTFRNSEYEDHHTINVTMVLSSTCMILYLV